MNNIPTTSYIGAVPAPARDAALLTAVDVGKAYGSGGFLSRGTPVRALDSVSLELQRGETLAVVGESGSGKSTLGRVLLRLAGEHDGRVHFKGSDVTNWTGARLREFRRSVQVVFQDPYSSLDPRMRVGSTLKEAIRLRRRAPGSEVRARVEELLNLVRLPSHVQHSFPHQLSGGQRQRVCIARALAYQPDVIVLDEPVAALDVLVQAQVLNVLRDLQRELGMSYIFITHDLGVARTISDRVAVMYLGSFVEVGETETLFRFPSHPYTQALIGAIPSIAPTGRGRMAVIQGEIGVPGGAEGCSFAARCPNVEALCRTKTPTLMPRDGNTTVACHFPLEGFSSKL